MISLRNRFWLFRKFLFAFLYVHDVYWAKRLIYAIDVRDFSVVKGTSELYLRRLKLTLRKGKDDYFIDLMRSIDEFSRKTPVSFTQDANGIVADVNAIKVIIETPRDWHTINEIFGHDLYNFYYRNPALVLDIGMNVGIASLFLAAKTEVRKVVGYEPFAQTYQQALKNLQLNPELQKKIEAHGYGIYDANQQLLVDYDYLNHTEAGIHGPLFGPISGRTTVKVPIELRSVLDELDRVTADNPALDLIAKIDCEGSEYEIIRALAAADRLRRFSLMMIEWHIQGPDELLALLQDAGFVIPLVSNSSSKQAQYGLIYAVRQTSSGVVNS